MGNVLSAAVSFRPWPIFTTTDPPAGGSTDHAGTDETDVRSVGKNPVGSKVYMYKQHPSVCHVERQVAWLPIDIRVRPETDSVVVPGGWYGPTDNEGNYLYDMVYDPDAFDAVHTLAVVEKVRLMYSRMYEKDHWAKLRWQWGSGEPIAVYTRAEKGVNAYYSRGEKSLKFFYFNSKSDGENKFTCRSWDTVAHETGHAILDGLQPGWMEPLYETNEREALHEAFGDLTAIFSVLDQFDMCELIIAHTKGDLRNRQNVLAVISEEFAQAEGFRDFGVRNAADNLKMSDAIDESHDLSKVFTGAVYDVLVRIFMVRLNVTESSPAETLYSVGKYLLTRFLFAIIEAPSRKVTFEDVAWLMIKNEPVEQFKNIIHEEFYRREVFDRSKHPKPFSAPRGEERYSCWMI